MGNTVINIENAVVSYREDIALQGVSLKVELGEFVGIIGPNGAGKTTLLTIVNGLGKLISGRVWVLGNFLTAGNSHSLRKKVGYVAQVENIDPRMPMNVREVLHFLNTLLLPFIAFALSHLDKISALLTGK